MARARAGFPVAAGVQKWLSVSQATNAGALNSSMSLLRLRPRQRAGGRKRSAVSSERRKHLSDVAPSQPGSPRLIAATLAATTAENPPVAPARLLAPLAMSRAGTLLGACDPRGSGARAA